jgi:predicted esterase
VRVKILAGLLGVSLLFNIAGLVFFICFLNVQSNYKKVRRERNQMAHNLSVIRGASVISEATDSERIFKRPFVSHLDGQEDIFGFLPPINDPGALDNTLIVYLHGMGSNYLEPFVYPSEQSIADGITARHKKVCFLSCNYRKDASWGNDEAVSDITQNIREVMQQYPFKQIVLMGTSMGGCTALNYAASAPADIKGKIKGVVSVEGAGDLDKLYKISKHPSIKPALIVAFKGTPEQIPHVYHQKSFLNNIDKLPAGTKVAVISAKFDKIVPAELQKDIVKGLEEKNFPVKLVELDGGHGAPPAPVYLDGFNWVMN